MRNNMSEPRVDGSMMIHSHHGMLDLSGIGLIANLIGMTVLAFAGIGIVRAHAPNVSTFWLGVALVGFAFVICGTGVVIASE
jgi:hypothetical protein